MANLPYIEDFEFERHSSDLLKSFDLFDTPVDVIKVAENLGIDVIFDSLDPDVSGALIFDENHPTICINEDQPSVRQRFTVAHEIGHFVLHKDSEELFIDLKQNLSVVLRSNNYVSKSERIMEYQANRFAASLLMPIGLLFNEIDDKEIDIDDENQLQELAELFEVSYSALSIRLNALSTL